MNKIITKKDIEKAVRILNSDAVVHSTDISMIFGKSHENVLRMIKVEIVKLMVDEYDLDEKYVYDENDRELSQSQISKEYKNLCTDISVLKRQISKYFIDSSYQSKRGTKPRFELTRKGFDYIVLSFSGRDARKYKRWFIDEFHNRGQTISKNKELAKEHKTIPFMIELRNKGKVCRKELVDAIIEFDIPSGLAKGKDEKNFTQLRMTNYTTLVYKILNIKTPKGANTRDVIEAREFAPLGVFIFSILYTKVV